MKEWEIPAQFSPLDKIEAGEDNKPDFEAKPFRKRELGQVQIARVATRFWDLSQISQCRGTSASPQSTFDLDVSGGSGSTVYSMDRKVGLDHDQFTYVHHTGRNRVITVPGPWGKLTEADSWHGTCVASKAVGFSTVSTATL